MAERDIPQKSSGATRVYVSCADEDGELRDKLGAHLSWLSRRGLLELTDRRDLRAGSDLDTSTLSAIQGADLVLVLISAAYVESAHWERELLPALERKRNGELKVVLILARPVSLECLDLTPTVMLPRGGVAIASQPDPEAAWAEISAEVTTLLEEGLPSFLGGLRPPVLQLLDRVERVSRLHEPEAQIVRAKAASPFFEYLEITKKERGRVKIYPVAALTDTPDERGISSFAQEIDARYRPGQARLESLLVHEGRRAPGPLLDKAYERGIVVQTFEEHIGELDLSHYLARQEAEVRSNKVYPPHLYIPQRARVLVGRAETTVHHVLDDISALLRAPDPQFLVVLADFGTGKSFLLRQLFLRLAGTKIIPVRVEMRALDKAHSLDGMLAAHFMQAGERAYDRDKFRYMLEEGHIALLFDGFDELALRVSYERAGDHLETLVEAAAGKAKVVLTSRAQHFLSDAQAKDAIEKAKTKLASRIDHLPGVRFIKLLPFNEEEILLFLRNKLGDPTAAEERFELLRDVKDLLGLSHNPRMLSFIADVPAEQLKRARALRGDVTAATLYEIILQQWLGYEIGRANPKGAPAGLDARDTWSALSHFAFHLWSGTDRSLDLSRLDPELRRAITSLGPSDMAGDEKLFAVGSGSLLVRDEEGRFSFIHRSVLEFLVAWSAACQLRGGKKDIPLLSAKGMSDLMADFFADEAGRPLAEEWAQLALEEDAPEIAKKNAELLLRRMGAKARGRAVFVKANLRGQDFTRQSLENADFSGADLSEAKLAFANLSGAVLAGATLAGADLTGANLSRADLSSADLSRAKMDGCDARGAIWTGAKLYRTRLVGAQLEDEALRREAHLMGGAHGSALPPFDKLTPQHNGRLSGCLSLATSQDLLVTGHADGVVVVRDVHNGVPLRMLTAHKDEVWSVAVSRDGTLLATGSADKTVRLWDLSSGETLFVFEDHLSPVRDVAFSPDGKELVSCSFGGSLHLLDLHTRRSRVVSNDLGKAQQVVFSADGQFLFTKSEGEHVRIWERTNGHWAKTLEASAKGAPTSLAVSPSGLVIAVGNAKGDVVIIDLLTKQYRTLHAHGSAVTALSFNSEGTALASGDSEGFVCLWDPTTDALLAQTPKVRASRSGGIMTITFGRGLVVVMSTLNGTLRMWSPSAGAGTEVFPNGGPGMHSVRFDLAGPTLAAVSTDPLLRAEVVLWSCDSPTLKGAINLPQQGLSHVEYSESYLAIASAGPLEQPIWLHDPANGAVLREMDGTLANVRGIAFGAEGRVLAAASSDGAIHLWRTGSGARIQQIEQERPSCIAASPVTPAFAWGSERGALHVLPDCYRGTARAFSKGGPHIHAVAFTPSGDSVLAACDDGSVKVWGFTSGAVEDLLRGHRGPVLSLAVCASSPYFASAGADHRVCLWDAPSRKLVTALEGHGGRVRSISFHPTGSILAAGCGDGSIHLWRVSNATRLAVLYGTPRGWVAYSPDGRYKIGPDGGDVAGFFWHVVGLCRFETGELDPYVPGLRKLDHEPLFGLWG